MKAFKIILLLCLVSPLCYAKQIAAIEFSETIRFTEVDKELKLNGLAIRYKFFFKIYAAALYVEAVSQHADILIKHAGAKRMQMHFLYDKVPLQKLVDGWLDGFEENSSAKDFKLLKPRIDQFNAMFETLHEGDVVMLDYLPAQGTRVTIKGKQKGFIEGEDFNRALLKIWLGDEPVTEELKQGLLGIDE